MKKKNKKKISEVAENNSIVRKHRKLFRNAVLKNNKLPYFNPDDVRNTLTIRYNLLENYLREFGRYFPAYYQSIPKKTQNMIKKLLGKDRLCKISASSDKKLKSDYISINEVFNLFCKLDLKKDFERYFLTKTHLSFTIHNKKIQASDEHNKTHIDAMGDKVPQFIHMILSEYIAIHNLMFISGYKIPEIKSIDRWLKDI
jgi:hypothetical protein